MKLEDCTKAELLWVIRYIRDRCIGGKHDLERALIDLEHRQEKKRLDEAQKYASIAAEEVRRYCELMKPYDGKRFIDIPDDVINRAAAILEKERAANKKYMELMGIKEG